MNITKAETLGLNISEVPGLDPVVAFFNDGTVPGTGTLTVTCYGRAWTAYWGAMGQRRVREFVASVSPDYLVGCLAYGTGRATKKERDYVKKISAAVIDAAASGIGVA